MRFVKSFLKELENSRRKQIVFFCAMMIFLIAIYMLLFSKIKIDKFQKFAKIENDFSWTFQVDNAYKDKREFVIEGWAFRLKQDSYQHAYDIILYDVETNKGYFPKLQYCERKDVMIIFYVNLIIYSLVLWRELV